MLPLRTFARTLTLLTAGVVLAACGGGGDSSSSGGSGGGGGGGGATTHAISGTAAVGAPLAGTVTIKDALGATRTVAIGTNGAYTVDVTGLSAPFLFRATGIANGMSYTVHSAALAADVDGRINITQLTDLIVDNVAGQLASNYFDSGSFGLLTPTALNAEVAVLKQRLLPVLTALGVDSAVDLLRTQFTPLSSALDTALDVLRVSVDPATNIATITNVVTQQQIADTITVPASSEGTPPALTTVSNLGTVAADTTAVKAALNAFTARFATSLPAAASLQPLVAADYLHDDEGRAEYLNNWTTEPRLIGVQLTDVDVVAFDYSALPKVTATVDLTVKDSAGVELLRRTGYRVRKDTDGVWRLLGNQVSLDLGIWADMSASAGTSADRCIRTGLDFDVGDNDPSNNGGQINHIVVYGPGLPNGQLRWVPPANAGGSYVISGTGSPSIALAQQCPTATTRLVSDAVIAAIPDNAEYLVVAYVSADDAVRLNFATGALTGGQFVNGATSIAKAGAYVLRMEKRPLTLAETVATYQAGGAPWPVITTPTLAALVAYNGNGVPLNVTGTASTARYVELEMAGSSSTTRYEAEADASVSSSGAYSASMSIPAALSSNSVRTLQVSIEDLYRRGFTINWEQAP